MKKRLLSFLLTFVMVFSLIPEIGMTVSADWEGYTPISSQEDLKNIADDMSGNYYLTQDIILTGVWTPLGLGVEGSYTDKPFSGESFSGILDGNGYQIIGLDTGRLDKYAGVGLFAANEGTIRNLTLSDVNVYGRYWVGGFAGINNGDIENCHLVDSKIAGREATNASTEYNYVGGSQVGGITGWNQANGNIYQCSVKTTGVFGNRYIGGVAGVNNGYINETFVRDCADIDNDIWIGSTYYKNNYSPSTALACHINYLDNVRPANNSPYMYTGGLVGANQNNNGEGTIEDCYVTNTQINSIDALGELIGVNWGTVKNSYTAENGLSYYSYYDDYGFFAPDYVRRNFYNSSGYVENVHYYSSSSNPIPGSGEKHNDGSGMKQQSTYSNWDFDTIWTLNGSNNENYGYPIFGWEIASQEVEYILNYDANGGEGAPQSQTVKSSTGSATFTVSSVEPTREGYDFLGWAETSSAVSPAYKGGDSYITSETTSTLYAVWKELVTTPNTPSEDVVESLLQNVIRIDCTNIDSIHNDATYSLLSGSYTIGEVQGDADSGYTCEITVEPDLYVDAYNVINGEHTLDPESQTGTIQLVWNEGNSSWEVGTPSSVTFTVKHADTPVTPEEPGKDFDYDLVTIEVECQNCPLDPKCNHLTQTYKVSDGEYSVSEPTYNNENKKWEIYVTVSGNQARSYIDKAVAIWGNPHTGFENVTPPTKLYTLIYNPDTKEWEKDASSIVTFEVNCVHDPIPVNPSIDGFTKERVISEPTDITLDLDNVTVNYDDPVVIPNGGSVTLLYKLTVIGDQGAKFIITDGGATLVGSDCGATQAADGKISGTIPASGEANVYVTKTFDADDIDNGNLKNTANIDAGQDTEIDSNVGDATVDTPASEESTPTNEFTLTYDGNEQANGTVENIPSDNNKYDTGDEVSLTVSPEPTHTAVNGSDVIFIGWSLDDADKIYAAGEAYPDIVTEVTFTDSNITVHAVWGYDTNDDDIPDVDQVLVTPADITIYVGGSGYTGAVDGTGDVVTSSGLPEPGFYVTLPAELDALLKANEGHMGNGPLDLSGKIIFEATVSGSPLKSWSIEKYDKDNSSTVTIGGIERYIYRIVPAKDQDPVRMQFRDDDGITISDQFNISLDTLYNEYEMSIYPGAIDSNTLYARCVNDSYSDEHYSLVTTSGILTIRGVVNDNVVTTEIEENLPADSDNVTAIAANGTEYFINGSNLVTNSAADVKLLVDDLVESGKNELKDYIIKADNGIDDNFEFEFKYLDLVDTSNGNVWIRPSKDMTIFWPYPEGTDKNTDFTIIHFDGLDRNYNDLDAALAANNPEYLTVNKVDGGITFTVGSFSPFAIAWSIDDTDDDDDDTPIIIPVDNKLVITKTVSGNLADENAEFTFMIELDRNVNGNYSGVVFVNGVAYVTLKGGESVVIEDLAPGTAYKVTELDSGEYTVTSSNEVGKIPYLGSVYVDFDNYLNIDAPELNTTDHIGYLIGRTPDLIYPEANMTRAEVATVFFRLLTDEARAENWTQENTFSDVELGDWYNNAISTISAMGIMNGYPDGTFAPNSPITRAEFITTAVRFFDYTAEYNEGTFIDIKGTEWFADYIAAGVNLGMIEGYPDGSFLPNEAILRCEVAAIINRTLGRIPDEDHLLDTNEMINWDDNLPGSWYYAHIQEASNSHDLEWVVEDGELVEQWTDKLDERDWTALERAWSDVYSVVKDEVKD